MMESIVYNEQGKEVGRIALPERVFGAKWNPDLVHQVVTSMRMSRRLGTAHAKGRGEVRGGGRKPWRQKGTGRARHGSRRSPLWVGGGVTHGPTKERNFERKVNKKAKRAALNSVLSAKLKDGEIVFVDALRLREPKTREAKRIVMNLSRIPACAPLATKRANAAYIALPTRNEAVQRSFRNIGNLAVEELRNLNALDALRYKYLVVVSPQECLKFL